MKWKEGNFINLPPANPKLGPQSELINFIPTDGRISSLHSARPKDIWMLRIINLISQKHSKHSHFPFLIQMYHKKYLQDSRARIIESFWCSRWAQNSRECKILLKTRVWYFSFFKPRFVCCCFCGPFCGPVGNISVSELEDFS